MNLRLHGFVLEINEENLGGNDIVSADTCSNIWNVLRLYGKYEEALVEHRKALAILRETLGEYHEYTATCYESIGIVFLSKARYDDALIGCGKVLSIRLRFVAGRSYRNSHILL